MNKAMETIEAVSVRAETLKMFCRALEDTAQVDTTEKITDRMIIERLYILFTVLDDEINILTDEINKAWEAAKNMEAVPERSGECESSL